MNKNTIIAVVIGVVLLGGGYMVMNKKSASPAMEEKKVEVMEKPTGVMEQTAKSFDVEGSNYAFSVKEIKVKKGDTVKIVFSNKDGMHDWIVDEFNAKTQVISAGQTETVEFVADKVGTFEYYCSVGQHRKNGMVGKLIVEE